MHCLLIHQAFAGPGDPGGTRHYEIARQLKAQGHEFTVVTSTVSYLTGSKRTSSADDSKVRSEGPRVLRVWTPATLHKSFAWRVVAFLVFSVASFMASVRTRGVDVVLGTSPPIFQAGAAWAVAWLKRVPFVLEVRDLWPEFAVAMGVLRNPLAIKLARWLERFLYARAEAIIVNSPAYRGYLLARGVAEERVFVVPNGVDVAMFNPEADGVGFRRRMTIADDEFVVMYTGALGMANDIPTILRAAEALRDQDGIRFVLVGDGKERRGLEELAGTMRLGNVVFTGAVPKEEIPEALAAANACIATLMNIPMFTTTYPNKVFDYMAAGRPTILAIDGVIRQVVEASRGGVFVPPGDSKALASAIRCLAETPEVAREMGESARNYVESHFDRVLQAEQFGRVLARVTEKQA